LRRPRRPADLRRLRDHGGQRHPVNYDPATFSASVQSGSTEEDQVYDSANGIGGTPSTILLPGRESVFRMASGGTDPADLVMEVTPGFEYESAIFTS
jgi:hypothetical protein